MKVAVAKWVGFDLPEGSTVTLKTIEFLYNWIVKAQPVVTLGVCMYVFTDREGTKCPKKTILGIETWIETC